VKRASIDIPNFLGWGPLRKRPWHEPVFIPPPEGSGFLFQGGFSAQTKEVINCSIRGRLGVHQKLIPSRNEIDHIFVDQLLL